MSKKWTGGPGARSVRIDIRVSQAEKAQIEQSAKDAGMNAADWVRRRILIDRPKVTT